MVSPYAQNIVLDLEFTPANHLARKKGLKHEVIQIGAIRIMPDGAQDDHFNCYVQPTFAESVSPAVRRLTGIHGSDICEAKTLDTALIDFWEWVGSKPTRYVTWSNSDYKQLNCETSTKKLPFPAKNQRWLDLQKVYPRIMGITRRRQLSLSEVAEWQGERILTEQLHGALYDARLTAQLLQDLLTGEAQEHKEAMKRSIRQGSSERLSSSIGTRLGALAALLREQEGADRHSDQEG